MFEFFKYGFDFGKMKKVIKNLFGGVVFVYCDIFSSMFFIGKKRSFSFFIIYKIFFDDFMNKVIVFVII